MLCSLLISSDAFEFSWLLTGVLHTSLTLTTLGHCRCLKGKQQYEITILRSKNIDPFAVNVLCMDIFLSGCYFLLQKLFSCTEWIKKSVSICENCAKNKCKGQKKRTNWFECDLLIQIMCFFSFRETCEEKPQNSFSSQKEETLLWIFWRQTWFHLEELKERQTQSEKIVVNIAMSLKFKCNFSTIIKFNDEGFLPSPNRYPGEKLNQSFIRSSKFIVNTILNSLR